MKFFLHVSEQEQLACFAERLDNHKWFRNLTVSQIIADAMEGLHMSYPKPTVDLADIRRKYHAAERVEKRHNKQGSKNTKKPK